MKRTSLVSIVGVLMLVVLGCKSKIDKSLELIQPYEKYFMDKSIVLDSIPVGFEKKLADFTKEFHNYSKSAQYLYTAAYVAEKRGKVREAAEYAAMYVDQYPSEKKHRMESAMVAAHYFETMANYESALKYYDILTKEFSNEQIGVQAKQTAEMIRKGAITPEQQLEYMIQKSQKDSAK